MALWLLLPLAAAVYVRQPLGELFGSPSETISIDLLKYFGGNDLNFTANSSSSAVVDANRISYVASLQYNSSSNCSAAVSSNRKVIQFVSADASVMFISYSGINLYFTMLNESSLS